MTDNLHRKANACRGDLRFLLEIIPEAWTKRRWAVSEVYKQLEQPTEQKITAAWQLAALIHEKIRQHDGRIFSDHT
jgi:hypothetical protein